MTTSIYRLLLPLVTIALAGCSSDGLRDRPGPTVALASSLRNPDVLPVTRSDASLRWEVIYPSTNIDESTGQPSGVDQRLTMAVAEPDVATWWLEVRMSFVEGFELQQALEAVVSAWSSVPCVQSDTLPLTLEVLAEPGDDAVWSVVGGATAPRTTMTLRSGGAEVATVTMDLQTTEDLQQRLSGVLRTHRTPLSASDMSEIAQAWMASHETTAMMYQMDEMLANPDQMMDKMNEMHARHDQMMDQMMDQMNEMMDRMEELRADPSKMDDQSYASLMDSTNNARGNRVLQSAGGPQWEVLFDGTSLDNFRGFKQSEVSDGWKIVNGNLTHVKSGGDIITREQYDDFELELEWKIQPNGNSGIFFNVAEDGYDHVWQTGPEMQVLDDERHYDGKNRLTCAGSNYALHAAPEGVVKPAGEWNTVRIVLCGDDVEHWLNGVNVVSYRLQSPEWKALVAGSKFKDMPDYGTRTSGHIALQDHGDVVQYRNIRIRRLN